MSQRVTVAPFHRRILPWIFIVVFLAVAPAVVFYTAGYRYNSKKGKVERNGTVILDTVPTGATITIDGQPFTSKSPVTIQDMAPGLHRFSMERDGYHPWGKSLDVRSELVTFANNVWLWLDAQPFLKSPGDTLLLSSSPDHKTVLQLTAATPTQAIVMDVSGAALATFSFGKNIVRGTQTFWSPNNRYVLLEAPATTGTTWLVDIRAAHAPQELPAGNYRWEGSELVGTDGISRLTISLSDFAVTTAILPPHTTDTISGATLQTAPGTGRVVYVANSDPTQGYVLPSGDWHFWATEKNSVVLRDASRWLSLSTKTTPPQYRAASGDMLRAFTTSGLTHNLLVNGTEIWTWDTVSDPQLIYRQSEPIVGAEWHTAGYDIFFATAHDVYALNLDARDGYFLTPLAHFDQITNFTALPKQLYIGGTKDGQTGIWTLDVQ